MSCSPRATSHLRSSTDWPWRWLWLLLLSVLSQGPIASAQTCQTAADIDAPVRNALETAAKGYFDMSARGDAAGLKQNSISSVASNFSGIEAAVKQNQPTFAAAQATLRPPFILTVDGPNPLPRAEFLCGVFVVFQNGKSGQGKESATFVLKNLPPGRYAVAILDVQGSESAMTLTLVLQHVGPDWKLAGYYVRPSRAAGHDAAWFIQHARDFKAKSQKRDAWLYYREAIALSSPVDFMSTLATDQLYDETQAMQPSDLPVGGDTADLSAATKTYHLTEIFPLGVGNDVDVVVKYQAADVSDSARMFQENTAVIKALMAKFPELREAFAGVVARAVDQWGRDYGTLLAMKDIK